MSEIKGYLLTEEEKACETLIKKMRKKEVFTFEFSGRIRIKAKTPEEASNIFRHGLENLHNKDFVDWYEVSFENMDKKERFRF